MALEIRELVIRVSVHERAATPANKPELLPKQELEKLKAAIVAQCIDAVLERIDLMPHR